ncbi:MAG: hypothetical protein QHH13_10055 [Melioribacter sp.]|uniref:hypothetical protein n=1 Tax=Rosettibacter primus TaxID=3111523 RepID=UPI00247C258B|nr:hypothetical protein [Melioribacter sp.]
MEKMIILSSQPIKLSKWAYALLGLSFILQSVTVYEAGSLLFYLILLLGIVLIFVSIFYGTPIFLKYIKTNEDGIVLKQNIFSKEKLLSWDKIKRLDANMHRIEITYDNGEFYYVGFYDLDYKTRHNDLKDFLKLIVEKGKSFPDFSIRI